MISWKETYEYNAISWKDILVLFLLQNNICFYLYPNTFFTNTISIRNKKWYCRPDKKLKKEHATFQKEYFLGLLVCSQNLDPNPYCLDNGKGKNNLIMFDFFNGRALESNKPTTECHTAHKSRL